MRVVSIMNYKGGVGKTTIAANIGAGLARHGRRVLLLDLDPQTNLTFSFYSTVEWKEQLSQKLTIKRWFDAQIRNPNTAPRLSELVVTPSKTQNLVERHGGRLDLIASHLQLVDVDMQLAKDLFHENPARARTLRLRLLRILADALEDEELATYDYVLIDCAPDFGIVNRTAIVASDWLLVPAKADHLSTLSVSYLAESVKRLVSDYHSISSSVKRIDPRFLGIAFTMVQVYGGKLTSVQQSVVSEVAQNVTIPVFQTVVRNAPREAIISARECVPSILLSEGSSEFAAEFAALTDEFVRRMGD